MMMMMMMMMTMKTDSDIENDNDNNNDNDRDFLFLGHRRLIKNKTQTAMINIVSQVSHFYKLEVSYAIQNTFSKVILSDR